jgi:hypothetical protein
MTSRHTQDLHIRTIVGWIGREHAESWCRRDQIHATFEHHDFDEL